MDGCEGAKVLRVAALEGTSIDAHLDSRSQEPALWTRAVARELYIKRHIHVGMKIGALALVV